MQSAFMVIVIAGMLGLVYCTVGWWGLYFDVCEALELPEGFWEPEDVHGRIDELLEKEARLGEIMRGNYSEN